MDTLSIPFGLNAGHLNVSGDEWSGAPAVGFELPSDERLIAVEHIPSLIKWLQEFVEETGPKLPTLPHAVIRARVNPDLGPTRDAVLSLVDPDDDEVPWKAAEGASGGREWFSPESIVSFEVLFPGVEDGAI